MTRRLLALLAAPAIVATACTSDAPIDRDVPVDPPPTERQRGTALTVYGRSEGSELFDRFEQQTGIKVLARGGGNPADLTDEIIEDDEGSPADVFYGPLSDALGSLSGTGLLANLSDDQLNRVPEPYRSPDGTWVGTSGRAFVVVYNTEQLSEDDLPDTIAEFTDPAWRGRIGWDPNNRALQGAITALRQVKGEAAARRWLEGIQANTPAVFDAPRAITKAVDAGKIIDVGFVNHYYYLEQRADGEAPDVAAKFYPGDPGGILQVAGVAILEGTDNKAAAEAFVDFLLSTPIQRYFAKVAREIPVVPGVRPPPGTPTADDLTIRGLDMQQLEDLRNTRKLLAEVGIIG